MNDDQPLSVAIDALERRRMKLVETLARLIDDTRLGKVVDMGEAASLIDNMASFCEPKAALYLRKLSLLVRRLPPSQLEKVAPYAVSIIFHYDKFPFTIVDVFPDVISN